MWGAASVACETQQSGAVLSTANTAADKTAIDTVMTVSVCIVISHNKQNKEEFIQLYIFFF